MCEITRFHRGSFRVKYGKNSSHFKIFTLTPLVALATNMRYGHRAQVCLTDQLEGVFASETMIHFLSSPAPITNHRHHHHHLHLGPRLSGCLGLSSHRSLKMNRQSNIFAGDLYRPSPHVYFDFVPLAFS